MSQDKKITSQDKKIREKPKQEYKERNYKLYWSDPDAQRLCSMLKYYRKKKAEGKDWIPKDCSKLALYCKERNLDVVKVIEGTQSITGTE